MGKALSAVRSQREAVLRALRFADNAARVCRTRGLELVGVYVVGSRARGDYLESSDIDLVLVISGVDGLNQVERKVMFKDVMEGGVDFVVLSPREWASDSPVVKALRGEAVPLHRLASGLLA